MLKARETVVLHAKRTKRAGNGNRKTQAPVGIDTEVTIGGQSYVLRAVAVHVGDFADSGHWKAYRHVSSTTTLGAARGSGRLHLAATTRSDWTQCSMVSSRQWWTNGGA